MTDKTFNYPQDFVPADYFYDVFGIVAGVERKVENIVIRTYAELPGYLRSLPIHHSQKELETKDGHTDFTLRLVPTFDFIQELLLHRDQLEVISPRSLCEEVAEIVTRMNHFTIMTRSRKKNPVETHIGTSQKRGKQKCNRTFRRESKAALLTDKLLPIRLREVMDQWNLGGDGKRRIPPDDNCYTKSLRK